MEESTTQIRIRLRNYLNASKNYKDEKGMSQKLMKANYVYKRVDVKHYSKGAKLVFAKVLFPKGPKFGNSFLVDGKPISYRNLYPAPDPHPPRHVRPPQPSRSKGSKYNFEKYIDQMITSVVRLEQQAAARSVRGVSPRLYSSTGSSTSTTIMTFTSSTETITAITSTTKTITTFISTTCGRQ